MTFESRKSNEMIKREFLKRQLEELGRDLEKVIASIQNLKEQGKFIEGIDMVQNSLGSIFDLSIEKVLSMLPDNFPERLLKEKKLTPVHLSYLGDILFAASELYDDEGETEKVKLLHNKILSVFNYINETEKTFSSSRNNKIEIIKRTWN